MSRRQSYTEKRRAHLRMQVQLEMLERKQTITEPISVLGLTVSAWRGLAFFGIIDPSALGGFARPVQAANQAGRPATRAGTAPTNFVPIVIGPPTHAPATAGGGGAPSQDGTAQLSRAKVQGASNWPAVLPASGSDSSQSGISAPWQPASRAGGGAALPPRGGSGNGALPAVVALVQGHTAALQVPPPPAPTPAIPFLPSTGGTASGPIADGAAPGVTRNAAALHQAHGSRSSSGHSVADTCCGGSSASPMGPSTVAENPSSLPSSTVGNGSGSEELSFPYFQLYVLDENNGIVLFNNQYQQATIAGSVDLYAQVMGSTASTYTYSWNTSDLSSVSNLSGTSTYHLHFQWPIFQGTAEVESVSLTVTNASSQQETQTFYFVVPTSNVVSLPSSASWPVTISPDLVEPGAPSIASQGVSVDADSGALDTSIDLPSYNPNVPAISLVYNSLTADPRPIIIVHHTLDPTQTVPTAVNATLTFNSTVGTTWYYNTSAATPGDVQQIGLQANATSLSTGRYSYSVQAVDERSTNTTLTYNGTATVLNQSSSAFGDGWTLEGLEQVTSATGGVILSLGDNGESLWFSGSPGTGQNYTSPAGDFSVLTKTSTGYLRTLTDGTQITFNSSGYQTASIDLNNNHTTFSYNGSNQLTSIEDPYGAYETLTYSSGHLSTIQDPAGRLMTFTFSGSDLQAVEQADGSFVTYTYDSAGRITQSQDQRSNLVTVAYDSAERVGTISLPEGATQLLSSYQEQGWTNSGTSGSPAAATLLAAAATTYTDPNGNSFQTRPDWMGLGQLGQATDPYGDVVSNDLNSSGLPVVTVDGLDRITQYNFDSLGNTTKITYPDLTNDQYTYNSDSEPLTHTDGNGHTTSYTYSSHGDMTGIQDPLNNRTTMTYTSTGQVQTFTDANDHTTTYLRDSQDRMTTIQFPDGTTNLYSYNAQGNAIKSTDGRGNATTYSYDALNRETGTTDALNDIATITYDAAGNVTKVQAPTPAGQTARTTTYAYDSMDRLTTVTDPLGYQTIYGFDADGNLVTTKDPMGRITTTQFDAMDRPVVVIDPMGNRVTTTFDADGEALTVTDALNRTTTYAYSVRGWVATQTDPMGFLATFTYTPTGEDLGTYQTGGSLLETSTDYYDADDRLIAQADGLGNLTSYTYDGVGNVISVTAANTNTTSYVYDSRNRLIETVEPLGVTVSFTYDGSGNLQTATDALGHTTTALYDALDRATTMTSAVGGITTITYDVAGRETSLTDPVGNKTQWAYDADDRLTTSTQPNGATVTYVYDNDGELTDTTDADGRRTTYSYNADADQTGETWVGASPSEKITYTYDADNELTGATDSFATLTFTYDKDGRLSTDVTSGPGTGQPTVTLTYSYDQLGDETSVTDSLSSQGIATYGYDNAQRVNEITTSYGGTAGPQVTFTYDNGSRLTVISRQIGSGSEATQVNSSITYDAANRVVTMTDSVTAYGFGGWSTTPLATQVYSYDDASRVTSEQDAEGTASFTYDNANELTAVTGSRTESYSYDLNGNRTGTGYSTTVMNETATSPGTTYTYDNVGNMITAKSGSTITTYTYDYRNRLTEVTTGGTVVGTYTYNALDQRIGVKDSGTQTWTVYDGTSADASPYADFNGSGTLTVRYLFGPGVVNGAVVDEILARTSSGGTTAWYLTDKLGSVRDIVSTSGTELDHIVYDSFGKVVTETNASDGDRFKFAGMQFDATTGQYYDHARWYGSPTGRFNSLDPLAFASTSSNLYTYTNNSSTNAVDPSGEISPTIISGLAGMAAGMLIGGISVYLKNPNAGFADYAAGVGRGGLVGLAAGLTLGASLALATPVVGAGAAVVAGNAAGGAVGNIVDQVTGMAIGVQKYYSVTQTMMATVLSVGLGAAASKLSTAFRTMYCFVAGTQVLMAGDDGSLVILAGGSDGIAVDQVGDDNPEGVRRLSGLFCVVIGVGGYFAYRAGSKPSRDEDLPLDPIPDDDERRESNRRKTRRDRGKLNFAPPRFLLRPTYRSVKALIPALSQPLGFERNVTIVQGEHTMPAPSSSPNQRTSNRRQGKRLALAWAVAWCLLGASVLSGVSLRGDRAKHAGSLTLQSTKVVNGNQHARATKSIEAIRPGDMVLARDDRTGKLAARPVNQVYKRTSDHLRVLQIRRAGDTSTQELSTTDNHPFWVIGNGWVDAGRLKTGQQLIDSDGRVQVLEATRREDYPKGVCVYNFQVEGYHTYFAAQSADVGFIWVHNDCSTPFHHLFSRQFKWFFQARGIDINKYTVPVPRAFHVDLHNPNLGNWNGAWGDFITANPGASVGEVMEQMQRMAAHNSVPIDQFFNYGSHIPFPPGSIPLPR